MVSDEQRLDVAQFLANADQTNTPTQQLSETYPVMTHEDSYRIQNLWEELRTTKGAKVIGCTTALTPRALQTALTMTETDHGRTLSCVMVNIINPQHVDATSSTFVSYTPKMSSKIMRNA